MSGELLRRGATFGDVESIKNLLEQGSNPCSTDVSSTNTHQHIFGVAYSQYLVQVGQS